MWATCHIIILFEKHLQIFFIFPGCQLIASLIMDSSLRRYFRISPEVQRALDHGDPVVSLESTIISHGMPFPENYSTAKSVENTIRREGVTPATIAIIDGLIRIGLSDSELMRLSKMDSHSVHKCTRRTLPYVLSKGLNGSTTVAATMYISNLCGIPIFVTGGIGGVHRGVTQTMDISADLIELSRTQCTVVCAGIKSVESLSTCFSIGILSEFQF